MWFFLLLKNIFSSPKNKLSDVNKTYINRVIGRVIRIFSSTSGYEHGYEHLDHLPHPIPYAGYVPVYGPHGVHDHAHGYAYGHDLIGPFDHHTGPFGPFGFYANFYHD